MIEAVGDGQLHWFGASWGAPVCWEAEHVQTPVGEPCMYCPRAIAMGDQGVTMVYLGDLSGVNTRRLAAHLDCFLQRVVSKEEEPS